MLFESDQLDQISQRPDAIGLMFCWLPNIEGILGATQESLPLEQGALRGSKIDPLLRRLDRKGILSEKEVIKQNWMEANCS